MIRIISLLCLPALVALSGCQNKAYFEQSARTNPDNAIVYVYRPKATNPWKKPLRTSYPEILVDGQGKGFLKYNQYLALELPQGKHKFVATGLTRDARWEPKDVDYTVNLEAGKTYYLRLRVEFNVDKMSLGSFTGQYLIHLHQVDESEALYHIRDASASS